MKHGRATSGPGRTRARDGTKQTTLRQQTATGGMSSSTKFRISDIRPNPFRRLDVYPLQEPKITTLRESIRSTGFWDNVVARIGPDGRPQLAYGHHRIEAVRRELGKDADVMLIVRDLDDEMMLRMMVRENMEDWSHDARMNQASIRAVVEAYAAGKVTLPPPHPKTPNATIRHAPSFLQGHVPGGDREDRPYTATTLMGMLGWDGSKIEDTLAALELIERVGLDEKVYDNLSPSAARFLTQQVRRCVTSDTAWIETAQEDARKWREAAQHRPQWERYAALAEERAADLSGPHRANFVALRARWCYDSQEQDREKEMDRLLGKPEGPTLGACLTMKRPTWDDVPAIERYLDHTVQTFCGEVDYLRSIAEQFSPEQMQEAIDEGRKVSEALDTLDQELRRVVRERQERGSAPAPREAVA